MSLRAKFRPARVRACLRGLRSSVLANGDPLFLVIMSGYPRQEMPSWESADQFAADLASTNPGKECFAQERRVLDGVHCLVRSRTWQFNPVEGVTYALD